LIEKPVEEEIDACRTAEDLFIAHHGGISGGAPNRRGEGELAQIAGGQVFRYLVYWDIQPVARAFRGQHYHLKKEESMYILRGIVQALFEDIDTQERKEQTLAEGARVIILPRLAHKFVPLEFVQVIEFSPQPFDPSDAFPYSFSS
jgi:hypothetical protein